MDTYKTSDLIRAAYLIVRNELTDRYAGLQVDPETGEKRFTFHGLLLQKDYLAEMKRGGCMIDARAMCNAYWFLKDELSKY